MTSLEAYSFYYPSNPIERLNLNRLTTIRDALLAELHNGLKAHKADHYKHLITEYLELINHFDTTHPHSISTYYFKLRENAIRFAQTQNDTSSGKMVPAWKSDLEYYEYAIVTLFSTDQ